MANDYIIIKGAREHNLKNIDLKLPRNKFIVITGISGSGKSSLAFDTIYAEGQRRYLESLSTYARQFLGKLEKPDVEYIEGLSPAIAIQQRKSAHNPRSIVATITEIYDYLRLLFARVAKVYCYKCNREINQVSVDEIVNRIMRYLGGTYPPDLGGGYPQNPESIHSPGDKKIQILAPVIRGKKGEFQPLLDSLRAGGFSKVIIDGNLTDLDEQEIKLNKNIKHTIEVIVDRFILKDNIRTRLAEAIETSLKLTGSIVEVEIDGKKEIYSERLSCIPCGVSFPEISPRIFSFNSPYGACSDCGGLGIKEEFSEDLIIDKSKSLSGGAIRAPLSSFKLELSLKSLSRLYGVRLDVPYKNLSPEEKKLILWGSDDGEYYRSRYGDIRYSGTFEGLMLWLERRYKYTDSEEVKQELERFRIAKGCQTCNGARLKKESLWIKIEDKSIVDVIKMSIKEAYKFFENLNFTAHQQIIVKDVLKEIKKRLKFLIDVGLEYLTLDRTAGSLSGGEAQRIQLATQIGSSLVGVLYVLDEPTIGLHQRDTKRLLDTLCKLRDLGNTLIVVEHDKETIQTADYIVDLGPGASEKGGYVVAQGTLEDIKKSKDSLTGQYLLGKRKIQIPKNRKKPDGRYIEIIQAHKHNLKNIDVKIPIGLLVCITGVSGSGKSTLLEEILSSALQYHLRRGFIKPAGYKEIKGVEYIDKVIEIDQSPIGRTPRSNPATYTGVFTPIRELFENLPSARARGFKKGRFSFNVKGGRCEACQGAGQKKIEMHFLADVWVKCEVCDGKRYNQETLQILYKGKNIYDILEMSVDETLEFFENIPQIRDKLEVLSEVGLGYIKLGQPATTLSGGEAQRVKLATELSKKATGKTLYILDEPTVGLHFWDIEKLINLLFKLRDQGNTIVIIEHHPDVIKIADYIIDLGPEGGDAGGYKVAEGSPEQIVNSKNSYTAKVLREVLGVRL